MAKSREPGRGVSGRSGGRVDAAPRQALAALRFLRESEAGAVGVIGSGLVFPSQQSAGSE